MRLGECLESHQTMFEELKENEVMCSACGGVFHYEKTKVVDEKYFIIHCLECVDNPERQPTQYGGEESD